MGEWKENRSGEKGVRDGESGVSMLGSLPGAEGNQVLATVRDMTAHRKAEQGLAYIYYY